MFFLSIQFWFQFWFQWRENYYLPNQWVQAKRKSEDTSLVWSWTVQVQDVWLLVLLKNAYGILIIVEFYSQLHIYTRISNSEIENHFSLSFQYLEVDWVFDHENTWHNVKNKLTELPLLWRIVILGLIIALFCLNYCNCIDCNISLTRHCRQHFPLLCIHWNKNWPVSSRRNYK